ncbi:MAG: hypothetical protein JXR14_11415 [Paracoccaceae bacterium]
MWGRRVGVVRGASQNIGYESCENGSEDQEDAESHIDDEGGQPAHGPDGNGKRQNDEADETADDTHYDQHELPFHRELAPIAGLDDASFAIVKTKRFLRWIRQASLNSQLTKHQKSAEIEAAEWSAGGGMWKVGKPLNLPK